MEKVEISILEDGPILVKGKTSVTRNGEKLEVSEQYALCRCGQTHNQCVMVHINHVILKDKNMYYQAIVAYETGVVDNEGNAKVKKFKYIVESESVFEVNKRLAVYLSEDTRDSEVVSIVKAPYEDILHPQLTPKYYNL